MTAISDLLGARIEAPYSAPEMKYLPTFHAESNCACGSMTSPDALARSAPKAERETLLSELARR